MNKRHSHKWDSDEKLCIRSKDWMGTPYWSTIKYYRIFCFSAAVVIITLLAFGLYFWWSVLLGFMKGI